MNKRWLVNKTNQEFLRYLSGKASISTTLAQIFVNRGIKDAEAIKDFLSPSLENLHDPFLMPDMGKAVEQIKTALAKGKTALVCGDYDADGVTSTAILVSALRTLGLKTHYHIPDRITEGYGLSKEGVQKAKALGAGLIITVDCGISSAEEVSMAVLEGINVIITDHHELPKKLPDATAIINPHIIGSDKSEYPFKYLAGAGVAYKLVQALFQNTEHRTCLPDRQAQNLPTGQAGTELNDLLALAAIGTIADSVPLTGENRILVTYGLKALNSGSSKPWVHTLKGISGIGNKEFRSKLLSFTIIPRINAAGRLGDANEAVELFLTEDTARAKGIVCFLEDQNRKRQRIEGDVYKSALNMIDTSQIDSAIVLYSSEWHPGVIGIVASRLAEVFYKPTFLFSVSESIPKCRDDKDAIAKGSARSIPPFHLYNGITECAESLLAYGGHSQAAGLRLYASNLHVFKEQINSIVKNTLSPEDMVPTVEIDAGVELFEANSNLVKELNLLEPFGNLNQVPLLGAREVEAIVPRIVGNNHLKMRLKQKSVSIDTIGFCKGNLLEKIENSCSVDVAFVLSMNEWNGTRSLQLNLKELRPSI